jgi:hypothetical protein
LVIVLSPVHWITVALLATGTRIGFGLTTGALFWESQDTVAETCGMDRSFVLT